MRYVALAIPVGEKRLPIDGPLHTFAGQRVDRDAGKVTGCGLILPSTADVYDEESDAINVGPRCGDCFPPA